MLTGGIGIVRLNKIRASGSGTPRYIEHFAALLIYDFVVAACCFDKLPVLIGATGVGLLNNIRAGIIGTPVYIHYLAAIFIHKLVISGLVWS